MKKPSRILHRVKSETAIIELADLLHLAAHPESLDWEPFRDGVEIHRLYGDGLTGPSAALIHFREEGPIPFHHHDGYEHILVLAGSQRDYHGLIPAGTLRIHPSGTSHRDQRGRLSGPRDLRETRALRMRSA